MDYYSSFKRTTNSGQRSQSARPQPLIKCAGLGGNTSSIAPKKAVPIPKKPKTNIFAAKTYIHICINKFRVISSTIFKKCYDRGDLPIVIDFIGAHRKVNSIN